MNSSSWTPAPRTTRRRSPPNWVPACSTSPGWTTSPPPATSPRATTATDDVTVVDHAKLFRNRPDLRFEHRIHEQIIPAIRRAGGEVAWTDLFVTHAGYDHSPEGQAHKLERDLRILHRELEEQPNHP